MANVSWVCPTIHPDLAIAPGGHARPLDPVPRCGGHAPGGRDDPPRRDPRRPDRVRAVQRPGARRGRLAGVPRRLTATWTGRPDCYHRPRRVPLDDGSNRRRPQRDGPTRRGRRRDRLRRISVAERPHDPDLDRDFAHANGWDRDFETYDDFDLPTYVGPVVVHEAAVDHRPGRAPPARGRRRDRRRAVRRRGQPPAGRPLRAAGDPRGAVHVGLDQLAPARRRAVRGPDRRRRRRRQHRPGLDRARPTR